MELLKNVTDFLWGSYVISMRKLPTFSKLTNLDSSDIWSDVNRRLFETIATISRVQLFLSQ